MLATQPAPPLSALTKRKKKTLCGHATFDYLGGIISARDEGALGPRLRATGVEVDAGAGDVPHGGELHTEVQPSVPRACQFRAHVSAARMSVLRACGRVRTACMPCLNQGSISKPITNYAWPLAIHTRTPCAQACAAFSRPCQ